jgi:hypothetical protein
MPSRDWPAWIDWDVWVRDRCRCVYCGLDGTDWRSWFQLEIDHIIPHEAGGTDASLNKAVACRGCNQCKHRYDPRQGDLIELTEASRVVMIENARRHVDLKKERLRAAYVAMMEEIEIAEGNEHSLFPALTGGQLRS